MKLKYLLYEILNGDDISILDEELKYVNENPVETWFRLRKKWNFSDKISNIKKIGGIEIFRGFSSESHLKNFLNGKHKPFSGIFGTGIFFSTNKTGAQAYSSNINTLFSGIFDDKKCINMTSINKKMIQYIEYYSEIKNDKSSGLKLWNKFKDVGLSSLLFGYHGVILDDGNIIIHNLDSISIQSQ